MNEMKAYKSPRTVTLICTSEDLLKLADRVATKERTVKLGDDTLVEYIHGKKISIAVRLDQDRL